MGSDPVLLHPRRQLVDQWEPGDGTVAERLPDTRDLLSRFDAYSFEVLSLVSEQDKVDIEAMATGKGLLDLVYVSNITMTFVINGEGKIETLREYPDYNDHGVGNATTG